MRNLGFEDFSSEIRANLAKSPLFGPYSAEVLKFNANRYESFNVARELAADLMERFEKNARDSRVRALFPKMVARLLSLQPYGGPAELPQHVMRAASGLPLAGNALAVSIENYLARVIRDNMKRHALAVSADVVAPFLTPSEMGDDEGREFASRTHRAVSRLIEFLYLDAEVGQTKLLGRALAAGLTRYARVTGDSEVLGALGAAVAREGLDLDNYVGNTVVLPDADGSSRRITLKNGDLLFERSLGTEAGGIGWAARPAWKNILRAERLGLTGRFWGRLLPYDSAEEAAPGVVAAARERLSETSSSTRGYSHVGIAAVNVDPETGIRMAWALDNYPNAEEGGIRQIGIFEQFAPPGPFMRFGVARFNAAKLWDLAQEQRDSPLAWVGEIESRDADGNTVETKNPVPAPWGVKIPQEDFRRLHGMPREAAQTWYEEVMRRVVDEIRGDMMVKEGIGFANGFTNFCGRTYCTQTIIVAASRAAGIDLQRHHDRWNPLLKLVDKLGIGGEEIKTLKLNARIAAPAGLIWQPEIDQSSYQVVDYPRLTRGERNLTVTQPPLMALDARVEEALERTLALSGAHDEPGRRPEDMIEVIREALRGEVRKSGKARRPDRIQSGSYQSFGALAGCAKLLER